MRWARYSLLMVAVLLCGCDRKPPRRAKTLHDAIKARKLSQVRKMVARGVDVNARDDAGWTPLHWAAEVGSANMIELLLRRGANPNVSAGDHGRDGPYGTPLHHAIGRHHCSAAKKLITGGADVNAMAAGSGLWSGLRPLHVALRCWNPSDGCDMVRLLLAVGADPDLKTKSGSPALHVALQSRVVAFVDVDSNSIHQQVKWLLAAGANPDLKGGSGSAALHEAIWRNESASARCLLDHGADINIADNFGDTPLHVAAFCGYADLFDLLRDSGADSQARNDLGQTPLDCMRPPEMPEIVTVRPDGQHPYKIINTHPAIVRDFLLLCGIEFDRLWIPVRRDVEDLDLEAIFDASPYIAAKSEAYRKAIQEYLPKYNCQYGGFVRAGRRYLICGAEAGRHARVPSHGGFGWAHDGGMSVARIVIDLTDKVVIRFEHNCCWIQGQCYGNELL